MNNKCLMVENYDKFDEWLASSLSLLNISLVMMKPTIKLSKFCLSKFHIRRPHSSNFFSIKVCTIQQSYTLLLYISCYYFLLYCYFLIHTQGLVEFKITKTPGQLTSGLNRFLNEAEGTAMKVKNPAFLLNTLATR